MVILGDKVKDTISGFKGIAIARHVYLQGCDRITVQPSIDKEGKLPDAQTFDEPQLDIIKPKMAKRKASLRNPGGPEKFTDPGRHDG